ncbi:MAG: hypothetical protein OXC02_08325 [Rhodobacteraceae bacterium]|nr:hypothetical protein [Paracoccaceae bacterium]
MPYRRYQNVLPHGSVHFLPPCLDDYVGQDNPVRAMHAYVMTLDLNELGVDPELSLLKFSSCFHLYCLLCDQKKQFLRQNNADYLRPFKGN